MAEKCNLDLNGFRDWANEEPNFRSAKIEIGPGATFPGKVWVYDLSLGKGQAVTSVSDIDLFGIKEAEERRELKRLAQKYPDELKQSS